MNELTPPLEKADELYLYFWYDNSSTHNEAIRNAIKAVNLILNETGCGCCKDIDAHYWNKVLAELEKIKQEHN